MIDLEGVKLDKNSAVPLYEQLRQTLRDAIVLGKLQAGTKLPTEEELCTRFGISRPVARQAYAALIEDGFIERARGRGTFVQSSGSRGKFLDKQLSFSTEMKMLGLAHRTELLRSEWLSYDPELFARLQLEQQERCYHLVRMRYIENQPFALVENYLPESRFPGIDQYNFAERSLYDVFESVYGRRVVRSQRIIAAQTAGQEFAELFGVQCGAPVLYIENLVYDQHDEPIDLSKDFMDGATQKFSFEVVNK